MKKFLFVLVLGLVLSLSACSGVSQEDYDALLAQIDGLEDDVDSLTEEKETLQDLIDNATVGYEDQTVEAYGYTHGGYVGKVTIVVTDGALDVEIDEAFLPHSLTQVTLSTEAAPTDWNELNTVTIGTKSYALFIVYNGTMFKALQTEAGLLIYSQVDETGTLKTGRNDVKNLEMAIIRTDGSMKAYYDALSAGELKLMTSLDDTNPTAVTEGLFKDGNPNYWGAGTTSLGWQANIDALEAFLEENGAAFNTLEFTKVDTTVNGVEDSFWQVADAIAGATNSDFPDYFQLAQAAFGQLVTKVK